MEKYKVNKIKWFTQTIFPLTATIAIIVIIIILKEFFTDRNSISRIINPIILYIFIGGIAFLSISIFLYGFYLEEHYVTLDEFKVSGKQYQGAFEEILYEDIIAIVPLSFFFTKFGINIISKNGTSIFAPKSINKYEEMFKLIEERKYNKK